MQEPVHGILGRDAELAQVSYFLASVSGGPSALILEGTAGMGKTTLWHAAVSFARARGHRVLSCRAAESEARLSYAALGDLFDFELWTLRSCEKRSRVLHQTSERWRWRHWECCARWPRPIR
jgi:AAA ATPase domain